MEFYENPALWIPVGISIVILIVALKNYYFGKNRSLKTDYFNEVKSILQAIHDHARTFGDFTQFLNSYPDLGRQILQHIYTFDKNAFGKLKESFTFQRTNQSQRHDERDKIFDESQYNINEKYWRLEYDARPEFGACKDCWKFLNKKQKQQYNDLKDLNDEFWDWTKW